MLNLERPSKGTVLIVDDEPANRELLSDLMVSHGYEVWEQASGEEALELLRESLPDAILLDVMMPGLDGFAVCRAIRDDLRTTHLPVLLVTALADRASRLKGIAMGATDFLVKPIDLDDVLLRVRNAIRSKLLFDRIQNKSRQLFEAQEAHDSLIHMIVHDLKLPLSSILGYGRLLERSFDETISADQRGYLTSLLAGGRHTLDMVENILSVHRLEADGQRLILEEVDLDTLLSEVNSVIAPTASPSVTFEFPPRTGLTCLADLFLLRRVLINLLDNAARFADPQDGRVKVSVERVVDGVEVSVEDNGRGILPEIRSQIFDKFSQGSGGHRRNFGLGLAFCKLALEGQGGRIWVEGGPPEGAIFRFFLPDRRD